MEFKNKFNKILVLINILYICVIFCCDDSGTQMYMVTEQPQVTYVNSKYVAFGNFTTIRYGRRDPIYYITIHVHTLYETGNNVTMDIYIYELLTNVYKRSFVEFHFALCDLIKKDKFFGTALNQGKILEQDCPFAPGVYHLYNMTVPSASIPLSFPFTKGRMYFNASVRDTGERIANVHINMELRRCKRRRPKRSYGNPGITQVN